MNVMENNNDIYLVVSVYDKGPEITGISLEGVFHTKKEAKGFKKRKTYEAMAEIYDTSDEEYIQNELKDEYEETAEYFHIKKIKNVCPYEYLEIDHWEDKQ